MLTRKRLVLPDVPPGQVPHGEGGLAHLPAADDGQPHRQVGPSSPSSVAVVTAVLVGAVTLSADVVPRWRGGRGGAEFPLDIVVLVIELIRFLELESMLSTLREIMQEGMQDSESHFSRLATFHHI